ncbi:MAG TPA: hypothetical protein VFN44_18000 [Solirubrobacteraceae bacterium]|nr:hypothetical protein [Solirubrobacteraceae bacterium]
MRRAVPAAAAVLATFAGGAAVGAADGPPRVVATDRDGDTVAALDLPRSGAFELAYRHSYYRRPARERFVAGDDGSFRLVEIASPSEAVLEYYDVEGARSRSGGWWRLRLARPVRFDRMPLAATAVGRRTLVAGGERVPLFRSDGRAVHVTIAVEGS